MPADVVLASGALKLTLDFAEVDTSAMGAGVRLRIDYSVTFQRLTWTIDELWIEYDELLKFEAELLGGFQAELRDMSDYPILHFERCPSGEQLTINPCNERQSADGEAMMIRLRIDSGSMQLLHASISDFPKWW